MSMGSVCANQSNPEKTCTDKEWNNEKGTHVDLPTPGDWACGGENNPSPTFVKFGIQPGQIGDEDLGLRDEMRNWILQAVSCGPEQTFSLPESYTTLISDTWDWMVGSVFDSSFNVSIDSSSSWMICGTWQLIAFSARLESRYGWIRPQQAKGKDLKYLQSSRDLLQQCIYGSEVT